MKKTIKFFALLLLVAISTTTHVQAQINLTPQPQGEKKITDIAVDKIFALGKRVTTGKPATAVISWTAADSAIVEGKKVALTSSLEKLSDADTVKLAYQLKDAPNKFIVVKAHAFGQKVEGTGKKKETQRLLEMGATLVTLEKAPTEKTLEAAVKKLRAAVDTLTFTTRYAVEDLASVSENGGSLEASGIEIHFSTVEKLKEFQKQVEAAKPIAKPKADAPAAEKTSEITVAKPKNDLVLDAAKISVVTATDAKGVKQTIKGTPTKDGDTSWKWPNGYKLVIVSAEKVKFGTTELVEFQLHYVSSGKWGGTAPDKSTLLIETTVK